MLLGPWYSIDIVTWLLKACRSLEQPALPCFCARVWQSAIFIKDWTHFYCRWLMRKVSAPMLGIAQDAKYHFTINDLLLKKNRQLWEECLLEMAEMITYASRERLLLQENKLKQIVSILKIIVTVVRPFPKSSILISMCRKFRDKNDKSNLGQPEGTLGK